jgi:quercetin dioxygenase-like cupin family protein
LHLQGRENQAFFYPNANPCIKVNLLNGQKPEQLSGYPNVITRLQSAEINVAGAKAWILQAEASQLVFFEFQADTKVPVHSHSYPQWGIVVDGKMELTVDGNPLMCEKGSEYLIPAGAKHYARFLKRTRVMDYFSEKSRYKFRTPQTSTT